MFPSNTLNILGKNRKSVEIRLFLLESVKAGRADFVQSATARFSVSRQAIHKHLSYLVENKFLTSTGSTNAKKYALGPHKTYTAHYDRSRADESLAYSKDFSFIFEGLPDNVEEIIHYGFTEMFNNAIDHSEGEYITVNVERDENLISILIADDGEGIFKRIARILKLHDPRESLLELSKGKLTTDPKNHTGEGIFFTSRAFNHFFINSGDLTFSHDNDSVYSDWLLHNKESREGTAVAMEIYSNCETSLTSIFDEYSSGPSEYRFDKTVVPVRLALYEGDKLVSRSQAKRILSRVERFKHVILDFEDVDSIGQAFADEIFRVFQNKHPKIQLIHINASSEVTKMINRAINK